MDILKLIIIFAVILIVMRMKQPIYLAVTIGSIITIIIYSIDLKDILNSISKGILGESTVSLVLAFYCITFLQRMLEKRGHLLLAEESLIKIFNSRRINATIAPFVIGLLPSIGAILIAAPIVHKASGDSLDIEEKAFVTSFYRHISEAFLPTYASILLALNLSNVDMTFFVIYMIPVVILLFYLGYFFYVRKIPKVTEKIKGVNKRQEVKNLIKSLWTIVLSIIIILSFKIPVYWAVLPVIFMSFIINKFSFNEIKPMFLSALEIKLILTTITIMIFKELLIVTNVIEQLPYYFNKLPISSYIIFGLIFFFGTLIAGSQAIIVIALPLAFATINNAGLPLLIFLMSMTYIAMQISPTHICLSVITEEYRIPFTSLVNKTMPVLLSFVIIVSIYSYILYLLI